MEMKPSRAYVIPMVIITLGLYLLWLKRTLYAVDDAHVVMKKGILNKTEETVPLLRVTSVNVSQRFMPGTSSVEIGTGGGEKTLTIGHLNRQDAKTFGAEVKRRRELTAS